MIVALRLALGRDVSRAGDVAWAETLATAIRERLGALAWRRSGDVIRVSAPRDVVERWRTLAVVTDHRGRQRFESLGRVLDALGNAGIAALVLKGMPLSQRLYGDPFVRTSDDIDVLVGSRDRRAAADTLTSLGWMRVEGAPPWDELFMAHDPDQTYLELHESLVTDYLAHLRLPAPEAERVVIDGREILGLGGSLLPASLAAHLAGHQLPPLLWSVDFLTLWRQLDPVMQADARRVAERVGLGRYLRWGIAAASTVDAAADGDREALARLGVRGTGRSDRHLSIARHARLATNPLDAARVVGACMWPRPLRWDVAAFGKRVAWGISYRGRGRAAAAKLRTDQLARASGHPSSADATAGSGVSR